MAAATTRVIVTGATGFLGGHGVAQLAESYDVVAVGRNEQQLARMADAGVHVVKLDLAGVDAAERLVALEPQMIVHAAAMSAPWGKTADFDAANVHATAAVVAACEQVQGKLVHISTPTIYMDGTDRMMITEEDQLPDDFINDYATTKHQAEEVVRASSIDSAILRPQAIVGAGDTTIAPRFLKVIDRGVLPTVLGQNPSMDLTHVANVVSAIELSARALLDGAWTRSETFNITNGDPRPIAELLALFLDARSAALGEQSMRKVALPLSLLQAAAWVSEAIAARWGTEPEITQYAVGLLSQSRTLNIDKARAVLGYDPSRHTIEDAFAEYFAAVS